MKKILNIIILLLLIALTNKITLAGDVNYLKKKGYQVFPIKKLKIVKLKGSTIKSSHRYHFKCDQLISGTFFGRGLKPVGPFILDEDLFVDYPKTITRGFIAVMEDGSFLLESMSNTNYDYRNPLDAEKSYEKFQEFIENLEEERGLAISELMGGGAHFIKPNDLTGKGEAVSIDSLVKKQFFDQGIGNLNQAQMRATNHVIVFQISDKTFAAITPKASGKTMQKHLLAAGAHSAIKFDGGSGCSGYNKLSHTNICPTKGANPSGLCIN